MHDAHATPIFMPGLGQKLAQHRFCLRLGESMQIDLVLNRILATLQLPQQPWRIAITEIFEHITRPER